MFWILSTAFLIVFNCSINTGTEVSLFQQFCFLKWHFPLRGSQFWSASLNCGYPHFDCFWAFHEADFKSIFIEGGDIGQYVAVTVRSLVSTWCIYICIYLSFYTMGAFSVSLCTDNTSMDKTMVDIVIKLSIIVGYMSSSHKTLWNLDTKRNDSEEVWSGIFCFSWYNLRHQLVSNLQSQARCKRPKIFPELYGIWVSTLK